MQRWLSGVILGSVLLSACDRQPEPARRRAADPPPASRAATTDPRLGLPLPPGARVVEGTAAQDGALLKIEAVDGPGAVIAYLRDQAKAGGYTVRTDVNLGNARMLGLARGEDTLTINAVPHGSGTTLSVIRGRKSARAKN
ncbi:MAG: hypothetical protein RQ833_04915 [Sphingomonadaceae bacterium]|nr:hypothetical protein [Sphingomonadaceae bacterium]